MANPYPNEAEIFERITREKITIHPFVWDLIYNKAGDHITVINLLVSFFIESGNEIPIEDSKRISSHTKEIMRVFKTLNYLDRVDDDDKDYIRLKNDNIQLHPLIKELFGHYIGNDLHVINMIVDCALDPGYEEPISIQAGQKILNHTKTMIEFINKLRILTVE